MGREETERLTAAQVVQGAKMAGASRIIGIDTNAAKFDLGLCSR
jgi:Zn-dependent alcohol dehydrogenase